MNRVVPFAPPRPGIDLAFEPDFSLGSALVRPSRHEVLIGDRCEILEPRVMQVLVALGRTSGETVTRDELIRRCWDGRFVSDDAINRTISKIRALAQLDGGVSFKIETRPRLGYRLFEADAPAARPVQDPTPVEAPERLSGERCDSSPHRPKPELVAGGAQLLPGRSGFSLPMAAAVATALVVLFAFLLLPREESPPGAGHMQLRLAGFERLTPDVPPSLAPSLREEVLAAFGEDDAVIVTSGSVTGGAGTRSFALSGAVRRVDDRLRFTLRLENENSGALLLTESVDRPAAQPAIAPRQAAVSLSQVIRCGFSGSAGYRRPLPDATLSLYFQYCQELWTGSSDDNNRALHAARRVAAATPDFSGGWSGIAASIGYIVQNGPDVEGLRAEGIDAAARAISLDPRNPEAWLARAILLPPLAFAEREEMHRRSVSVSPSDCGCAQQFYGHFLANTGRVRDAIPHFRRSHEMQPLGASANMSLAAALSTAGQPAEAISVIDRTIGLWPERKNLLRARIRIALSHGRYQDGLRFVADPNMDLAVEERSAWSAALAALMSNDPTGRDAAADALERVTREPSRNDPFPVMALGALGRNAEAIAVAERLIQRRGPSVMRVLFEPPLAQARHDPAFAALVQKLRMIDYWRDSGRKPDFCQAPNAPALCRALV